MSKVRLDLLMVQKKVVTSRSQAESFIKLGKVFVNKQSVSKPGLFVPETALVELKAEAQYVSRAGLKLASVASVLPLHFQGKVVLDVGSSTGGFTDFSLQHGAVKVIAIDVGTNQLHPSLRTNPRIELYEKTDIRQVQGPRADVLTNNNVKLANWPDIVVIDVSFISLRAILPHIFGHLVAPSTQVVAMLKPQFEAGRGKITNGVIKNDTMRRQILKDFEAWVKQHAVIMAKADSEVAGARGNRERFYLLKPS